MAPIAITERQGTRKRLRQTGPSAGASQGTAVSRLVPMRSSCGRPGGGPCLVRCATVLCPSTSAGPRACTSGPGPATSAVGRASTGRRSISSLAGASITREPRLGKADGPSRPSGAAFRRLGRLIYGALAGPTLPFTTAICRRAGPKRAVPS